MDYVKEAKRVFNIERPRHFLDNPNHCDECCEVEEKAQRNDIDSLTIEEAGEAYAALHNFLNNEGFLYYFPAFIRLSIESRENEGYIENLLFALTYQESDNRILKTCSTKQRKFVLDFFKWFKKENTKKLREWFLIEDIERAINIWSV